MKDKRYKIYRKQTAGRSKSFLINILHYFKGKQIKLSNQKAEIGIMDIGKQNTTICSLQETQFRLKDTNRLKAK